MQGSLWTHFAENRFPIKQTPIFHYKLAQPFPNHKFPILPRTLQKNFKFPIHLFHNFWASLSKPQNKFIFLDELVYRFQSILTRGLMHL